MININDFGYKRLKVGDLIHILPDNPLFKGWYLIIKDNGTCIGLNTPLKGAWDTINSLANLDKEKILNSNIDKIIYLEEVKNTANFSTFLRCFNEDLIEEYIIYTKYETNTYVLGVPFGDSNEYMWEVPEVYSDEVKEGSIVIVKNEVGEEEPIKVTKVIKSKARYSEDKKVVDIGSIVRKNKGGK